MKFFPAIFIALTLLLVILAALHIVKGGVTSNEILRKKSDDTVSTLEGHFLLTGHYDIFIIDIETYELGVSETGVAKQHNCIQLLINRELKARTGLKSKDFFAAEISGEFVIVPEGFFDKSGVVFWIIHGVQIRPYCDSTHLFLFKASEIKNIEKIKKNG